MRVLITGASGLIGGRLVRHLATSGHDVIMAARNPGSPSLPVGPECVTIDLDDADSLDAACSQVDVVVHAAGMNAADCQREPALALAVNGAGTGRLADSARRSGVRRFIYLSTAHVYCSPLVGTITEQTAASNPHPYATSHLAGEYAAVQAAQGSGMGVVVLRLSNAFGAPVHPAVNCWQLLANDLCRQWAQANSLKLNSGGQQQRDFVALTAVCQALDRLLDVDSGSVICNLGGGSLSVLEMAQRIQSRAEALGGSRPSLELGSAGAEQGGRLLYRSDRLHDLIGPLDQDADAEIDQLLLFCQRHFGAGR